MWIGELEPITESKRSFKRPAVAALGAPAEALPFAPAESLPPNDPGEGCAIDVRSDGEIGYEERGAVGYLHFDFYNGALSTAQCERLRAAYAHARARPTRVIVLMGGVDFWCNGMHLHCIEAAIESGRCLLGQHSLHRRSRPRDPA